MLKMVIRICLIFYFFTIIGCKEKNQVCSFNREISNLKDIETKETWNKVIKSNKVVKTTYFNTKSWEDGFYLFKSYNATYFRVLLEENQQQKIESLYDYQWQTHQTTLSKNYNLYLKIDSVVDIAPGLDQLHGIKYHVFGSLECLEIEED